MNIRDHAGDLVAFVAVARMRSFTRAAAQLGLSQSRLSQTMRRLEEDLGVRLLARSTRTVTPTQAGIHLLETLEPRLKEIEEELEFLHLFGAKPAGTVRISATENAAASVIWPALTPCLTKYPDIKVEIVVDYGLTDIVADGLDAGVRHGDLVTTGMIAVKIGPEMRMAVVGSPAYHGQHGVPRSPRDLSKHRCVNLRLPTHGGIYAWEFDQGSKEIRTRVEGSIIVNTAAAAMSAAVSGLGLAYLPEDTVRPYLQCGELLRSLENWCAPFKGYHLYYPSRRQMSPAMTVVVEALRYREE